jgi:hypothetical protein
VLIRTGVLIAFVIYIIFLVLTGTAIEIYKNGEKTLQLIFYQYQFMRVTLCYTSTSAARCIICHVCHFALQPGYFQQIAIHTL